jgi:hypothetical protein
VQPNSSVVVKVRFFNNFLLLFKVFKNCQTFLNSIRHELHADMNVMHIYSHCCSMQVNFENTNFCTLIRYNNTEYLNSLEILIGIYIFYSVMKFLFKKTGFHYVAQDVLELTMYPRLAWNWRSSYLSLIPSSGMQAYITMPGCL